MGSVYKMLLTDRSRSTCGQCVAELSLVPQVAHLPTSGRGGTHYLRLPHMQHIPATEQRLQEIKQCQETDRVCQQLMEFCQSGWPEKSALSPEVKPYFPVSAQLSVENGLLLRGCRIIIPPPLRKKLLNKIHSGHQGITKCREMARQSVWWTWAYTAGSYCYCKKGT